VSQSVEPLDERVLVRLLGSLADQAVGHAALQRRHRGVEDSLDKHHSRQPTANLGSGR
jgi:hypothetical protein